MPKLSPSIKALINAPFARPGPSPAPSSIREVYLSLSREASEYKIGTRPWLALSAAATFTLNSPDSLAILHDIASSQPQQDPTSTAELIREVGLKCIAFNGIPRSINCLNAFYAYLPTSVTSRLSTTPSRCLTPTNLEDVARRGRGLWDSVYAPLEDKLYAKLALAHPDLPVHILGCNYGPLLSDPVRVGNGNAADSNNNDSLASVGRVLTSVVAVACLRAQTGVGPQVLSHVFGLRKGAEDGTCREDEKEDVDAAGWLASDEGVEWILRSVDRISEVLGGNFAPRRESKI